ncbi:carboxylating nicotinate-nucleotide diphosphorylase [Candidatus Woesearchaeota archaeon]|nr:carboxylating nicotinate-nucleotide diphosphorylase [Candidatus Woesearchaeota archaeon]
MDEKRRQWVKEFFDRSSFLNFKNREYYDFFKNLANEKLKGDIGEGDITTLSLIDKRRNITAVVKAKQDGIAAGIEESSWLLEGLEVKAYKKDGDEIKNGDIILEIHGNAGKILSYERTVLDIVQRMSGIATKAYELKQIVKNNCFIAATRKTLLYLIDKKAVSVGGALTHRLNLNDFILIKSNHLKLLDYDADKALKLAAENEKAGCIEIEAKNKKTALEAAETISKLSQKKMFAIMFDNMKPNEIKNLIKIITNNYAKKNLLFEASGGINQENIEEYSKTGVDIISLGCLTHSPKAFDMSLEIK